MTGFFISVRGLSFSTASRAALEMIALSKSAMVDAVWFMMCGFLS
jgi:hypothetical protein